MPTTEKLAERARVSRSQEFRPRRYQLPHDQGDLDALLRDPAVEVYDTLEEQLIELGASRAPQRLLRREEALALGEALAEARDEWVYYPWSRRLVRVLPPALFRALRADRNRNKITTEEQARLQTHHIGVVGLSVGKCAALTLAMEGVGGYFKLADFDVLGLSNLNRLQAPLSSLGCNKAVLAAREIAELDPFAEVEVFSEGITEENVERFLDGLDLVVEECDDLRVKLLLRERAKQRRIPLLMETSDRGLLDIERFDLEPTRPIFHGLLGDTHSSELAALTPEQRVSLVIRILGEEQSVSARASLLEIKQSLSTWPQLASAISLGGALITDTARRILLSSFTESGRFAVDLEALIAPGTQQKLEDLSGVFKVAEEAKHPPSLPSRPPPQAGEIQPEELRFLISCAALAPSGGNAQPWRFVAQGATLYCQINEERSLLDFRRYASYAALGAALENINLAASSLGLEIEQTLEAQNLGLRCRLRFSRGERREDPLFLCITKRHTRRGSFPRRPLSKESHKALSESAAERGASLLLVDDSSKLAALGEALGAGERLRFFSSALHQELFRELRLSPQEARSGDGIDAATLELPPVALGGLRFMRDRSVIERLKASGGGAFLERPAQQVMETASAAGLLCVEGEGPEAYLRGGMAMQRLWLCATEQGLAFQPLSALPYLAARAEHGGEGLSAEEVATLKKLSQQYRSIFTPPAGQAEVLLFRVFFAPPPSAWSLRLPLSSIYQEPKV